MSCTIYTYPANPRAWKSLIAAAYAKVDVTVSENFNFPADAKAPAFLAKFPCGKVPAMDTPHGPIYESSAMMKYIARTGSDAGLYGTCTYSTSVIDQWIDFATGEIDHPLGTWVFPILGYLDFSSVATEKAKNDIKKSLTVLNNHLSNFTYLVGERVTLADIAVAMSLHRGFALVFDPSFRKPFPAVVRWYKTIVRQANVLSVVGETELCTKMAVATPKEGSVAAEPEKVAEEPKKEAKPTQSFDDEEDSAPKKAPNALDLLPASKMSLDGWKVCYSNNDTRTVAVPYLWENFDADGWSLWLMEYKYNKELTKTFMTANLVGGFIQRLDPIRKYGFASFVMFGVENDMSIGGVFMIRGNELPDILKDVDDVETYDWKKVDIKSEADRAAVADFLCWEGEFAGRTGNKTIYGGKVFK